MNKAKIVLESLSKIDSINEGRVSPVNKVSKKIMDKLIENNLGREGKTLININGDEVPDWKCLSPSTYVSKDSSGVELEIYNIINGTSNIVKLTTSEAKILKQLL